MSFTKFMRGFIPGAQKATDILTEGIRERGRREYATSVREEDREWQEKQTQKQNIREDILGMTDESALVAHYDSFVASGDTDAARMTNMRVQQVRKDKMKNLLAGLDEVGLRDYEEQLRLDDPERYEANKGLFAERLGRVNVDRRAEDEEMIGTLIKSMSLEGFDAALSLINNLPEDERGLFDKQRQMMDAVRPTLVENKEIADQDRHMHTMKGLFTTANADNFGTKLAVAADYWRGKGNDAMANLYDEMSRSNYNDFLKVKLETYQEEYLEMLTQKGSGLVTAEDIKAFKDHGLDPARKEYLEWNAQNPTPKTSGDLTDEALLTAAAKEMYNGRGKPVTKKEAAAWAKAEIGPNLTEAEINRFYHFANRVHEDYLKSQGGRSPGIFGSFANDPLVRDGGRGARALNVAYGKASTALFGGHEDDLLLGGTTKDPGAYIDTGELNEKAQQAERLRQEEERRKSKRLGLSINPLTTMLSPSAGLGQAAGSLLRRSLTEE